MDTKQKNVSLQNRLLLLNDLGDLQTKTYAFGVQPRQSDQRNVHVSPSSERLSRPSGLRTYLRGNLSIRKTENTLLLSKALEPKLASNLSLSQLKPNKNRPAPFPSVNPAQNALKCSLIYKTNPCLDKSSSKSSLKQDTSAIRNAPKLAGLTCDKPNTSYICNGKEERIDLKKQKKPDTKEPSVKQVLEEELSISRPVYKFVIEEDNFPQLIKEQEASQYNFSSKVDKENPIERQRKNLESQKCAFLNKAAVAIVEKPAFSDKNDKLRVSLLKLIKSLKDLEPEFILKVALYLRKDLNVRSCAHFILAAAAFHPECRPYLKRYFSATIVLPSDWIECAEFYVSLHDKNLNFGSLPVALRRVMIEKFPSFDEYQLGKYNKEKTRLKKGGQPNMPQRRRCVSVTSSEDGSDSESESEEELQRKTFTLKQLIRKLHISEPVNAVMCLVGKPYPATKEEFRLSRLEGVWQEARAGKRMKLPTPETWETQVSLKGNKSSTWEQLLDHRKLPFMAMLRNMRNMLQAGMSNKHHNMVIKRLTDEKSVINSKQFPFRFFSSYEVLSTLDQNYKDGNLAAINYADRRRKKEKKVPSEFQYDSDLIARYQKALDTALRISCVHNINPISGTSVVICDVSDALAKVKTAGSSFGKRNSIFEVGLLLGLMAKYSCEECKFLLFKRVGDDITYSLLEIENQATILPNLAAAKERVKDLDKQSTKENNIEEFFLNIITERIKVDNIISFGARCSSASVDVRKFLTDEFAQNYRNLVNPKMLFVSVNLEGTDTSIVETGHPNNLQMFGYSDQLLRYVAERGNDALMSHVDNIDLAYNLRSIKISGPKGSPSNKNYGNTMQSVKTETSLPCWRNVRVFISSTFRDMHGERDLLTRYVFPELRSRAMQHFINIYEIDLRWGINDEQSKSQSQVDICLSEVGKSDLFIGILGGRYGWIPDSFDLTDIPGGERLENCSAEKSITELEMRLFALSRPTDVAGKAFFYIRDQKFARQVPSEYEADFLPENTESEMKLEALKDAVKTSGLEVYENYPCTWGGKVDGKPVVANLAEFGTRVLNNLWTAVKKDFLQEEATNEDTFVRHDAFAEKTTEHFVGRKSLIKQCQECISTCTKKKCGVLMVSGSSGSGKTSFMAKLCHEQNAEKGASISYFADAASDARSVPDLVRFLYSSLMCRVQTDESIPENFRDLQVGLASFLEQVGKDCESSPLVIFIDGIDMLSTAGRTSALGWLPDPVPKGIIFVISCLQNGACCKSLDARKNGVEIISIGPLDMMERTELVRRLLRKHRKVLDESAFNNQMKLLVSKTEAKLPIFLKFACEELRFFGVYEKVSDHLRKLAQTVPTLLQSIANRLEMDHGKYLVSWCLIVLYISRQGMSEDELYEIVCGMEFCQNRSTPELTSDLFLSQQSTLTPKVSRAFFTILTRSLRGFIQQSEEQSLQLSFSDARNLVKQRYLKAAGSENVTRVHRILAAYYKKRAFDGDWLCRDAKALSEVTYHMASGGLWKDLEETLCSFFFIYSKFKVGLGSYLLEDFLANVDEQPYQLAKPRLNFIQSPRVKEYQSFIRRNLHILNQYPVLVFQQALNDPESLLLSTDAAKCSIRRNVVHWINKPPGSSPIKRTMTGFHQAVVSLDVSTDGGLLACGTQDGVVRLFDTATGNDAGSFIGHSSAISSCCFVGPKRIASASLDGTLSIWDVAGGHRVHHLKGHRRGVTDCMHVPSSQQIVSVSLDCQAILWNAQSGSIVSQFKSGGRPLNCVSCHPDGNLVALAGWNCLIKVWDILTNKRKKVLTGHKSSVRAVAFSPTGEHLVSAALLGDVFIWATASGVRVGNFSIGSLTLNHLKYTISGMKMLGASADSSVKVWSGSLGHPNGTFSVDGGGINEWAWSVTVSQDGSLAYVGYHDGNVACFDYTNGKMIKKLSLHKSAVRSICLSKDNNYLLTGSDDRTAKVVNLKTWKVISLEDHSEGVRCVKASKSQFATCSDDCTIMLWNALFLEEKSSLKPAATLQQHTGHVTCCDFSPCETRLMTGSTDKSLVIWDLISLMPVHVLSHCHRDWINACAWSDVGDFVVTGSNDFTLKLWDAKTGAEKYQFLGNSSAINSVAYKFGCIASSAFDGSLRIWTHKGAEITTINAHKQRVNGVLLWAPVKSGDCDVDVTDWNYQDIDSMTTNQAIKSNQPNLEDIDALTVSDDGTLKKWKPFKSHLIQNLNGHTDVVSNLAVSPSGEELFSASFDKTVKCWDVQKVESKDMAHTSKVTCVKIGLNGSIAATSGRDGSVVLWDLSSNKQIRTLQISGKSANCVCFTAHDKFVVGDDECMLTLMDINGNQLERRIMESGDFVSPITAVESNGQVFACANYYFVHVYSLKDGHLLGQNDKHGCFKTHDWQGLKAWNLGLDLTSDGRSLLAFHCDDFVTLCTMKQNKSNKMSSSDFVSLSVHLTSENSGIADEIIEEIQDKNFKYVASAKFLTENSAESTVICGTSDGYVELLYTTKNETDGSRRRIKAFKAHEKSINGLKILDDHLITASSDTTVKVWQLPAVEEEGNSLKQIGLFFCRGPVTSLDAHQLGEKCFILAGDETGNVEILEFFD